MHTMGKPRNEDNIMQCSGKVSTFCIRKSHSSPVHALSSPVLLPFVGVHFIVHFIVHLFLFLNVFVRFPRFLALLAPCTHRSRPTGAR